jgi:hypothetical protein
MRCCCLWYAVIQYGFKPSSTYDALAALLSPLRARQVLGTTGIQELGHAEMEAPLIHMLLVIDNWTALEIAVFEEAFDRFGKNFHAIAEQVTLSHLPAKHAEGRR